MDITIIISAIISLSTGVAGYLFGRRGANATAQGTELENVSKSLEIYEKILDNLEARLQAQLLVIEAQEIEIQNLRAQLKKFKAGI